MSLFCPNSILRSLLICVSGSVLLLSASILNAETTRKRPDEINKFLTEHCAGCHEGEYSEANFDITALQADTSDSKNLERWVRIYDRVEQGEMPPEEGSDLSDSEREAFGEKLSGWIRQLEKHERELTGRVQGRRLTNLQLERTLHDLLGIDIPLAERMPEEPKSSGFTTVSDGQAMSHFQLQQHLDIVDLALDDAFQRALSQKDLETKKLDAKAISRTNPRRRTREPELIDGMAVTWSGTVSFYGRVPATTAREDGWYRFTVRAKALNIPKQKGVWCSVRSGKCVSSSSLLSWVGAFEATEKLDEWTFQCWLEKGEMLEIRPADVELKKARFAGGQIGTGEGGPQNVPGVAIENIVVDRIHLGPTDQEIRKQLLGDLEISHSPKGWKFSKVNSDQPRRDLKELILEFANRAFRRPVTEDEIEPYLDFAMASYNESKNLLDSIRLGYRSLLCSPRFLYFTEPSNQLDDYELATRMSYFLWNSPPDEELLDLASRGKLQNEDVLRDQVQRMLADSKALNFLPDFAAEWLDLSEIDFTTPDRRLHPDFDLIVQESMLEETHTFLQYLLDNNLSVTNIIRSDHTFLNERLARYYEIDGIEGDELQYVSLNPQSNRGGLLTQGAILKVTANGTTTSPVLRGVWVSERLLGVEIPPPPSGIPGIEPDIRGATTIREMLDKHKSDPSCASCHKAIDPPGFVLEHFDASGAWRDRYPQQRGKSSKSAAVIDPSNSLASGESFDNLAEFQELVCQNPEGLAENLASKLLTYGTGAPISFSDRDEIKKIVEAAREDQFGFRTIVEEVVVSDIFQSK
ncbi:DUF1592 domain-containing protein [Thalassoglobus sp. JC818]|uniref:DUF1592 domain-containing protein n=1 Tax=Thalassoglobus sp. JC818 TaxID=3232136 RepID=UPI003458F69E